MTRYEDYGYKTRCLRSLLLVGNIFFCLLGAAIIAAGIYLLVEKIYFIPWVYGTNLAAASCYIIIAAGSIMFMISFIGCFGVLYQNKKLLLIFSFVLVVVFLLAIIGAVVGVVFRVWVSGLVKVYMRESLLSLYGTNMQSDYHNLVTRCWDEVQEKFQCCGIEDQSWALYRQTFWYKDLPGATRSFKPYVPASCCVQDGNGMYKNQFACQMSINGPPGRYYGQYNNALYYKGCFEAGKAALYPIVGYFIGIGFIMAFLMIGGIACALSLYSEL